MNVDFLFDSSGRWIAFRSGSYVFSPAGDWIGWLPWSDDDVVSDTGEYLGTIFPHGRLFRILGKPYRGYPGVPPHPPYPGYPGYPKHPGYLPPPAGATDVGL